MPLFPVAPFSRVRNHMMDFTESAMAIMGKTTTFVSAKKNEKHSLAYIQSTDTETGSYISPCEFSWNIIHSTVPTSVALGVNDMARQIQSSLFRFYSL